MHRLAVSEPAVSDVVRQRLSALLAEVPARRAVGPVPDLPDGPDESQGTESGSAEPAVSGDFDRGRRRHRPFAEDAASEPVPAVPGSRLPSATRAGGHRRAVIEEERGSVVESLPPVEDRPVSAAARWGRAVWEFSRSHLLAIGIVLLTGCLWAGYNVLQARSEPVAAPVPATVASVVASPTLTPSVSYVLVHVLGAVRSPGVVQLTEGSRVLDAIDAAGGLTSEADPGELNLAAQVADGAQIVVGDRKDPRGELRSASGSVGAGGGEQSTVSLNTATQAELETLPGVGPVTAKKILDWREQHGKFSRVEDLQQIDGIGAKTFAQLEPHVSV